MAELFPYPSESPDDLRRVLEGFHTVVGNPDLESGFDERVGSDGLTSVAVETAGRAYQAFKALVSAVEQARADIDGIRQNYARDLDELNASLRTINAEAEPQGRLDMLQARIAEWNESASRIHWAYGDVLSAINSEAGRVVMALEAIDRKCMQDVWLALV